MTVKRLQHISDNGHIELASNEYLDGREIVRTGSPTGRFLFTDWDTITVGMQAPVHNVTVQNLHIDGRRRTLEGREFVGCEIRF